MRLDEVFELLQTAGRSGVIFATVGLFFIVSSIYLAETEGMALSITLTAIGGMLIGHSMGVDSVRMKFARKIARYEDGKHLSR